MTLSPQLAAVISIAKEAGEILKKYHKTNLKVRYKADEFDPVTQADTEADAFLRTIIARQFPGDEILSEEHEARPSSYEGRVWMVDPLDGTKDFIAGLDSFSVMIGLLVNHQPTLGVVYLPTLDELFYAEAGKGSYRVIDGQTHKNHVSSVSNSKDAIHVLRNNVSGEVRALDELIKALPFKGHILEGTIGKKIGLVASGQADAFINTTNKACKWDTLAGHIILAEAGGVISDLEGNPLDYTKPTLNWDKYFVATNTDELRQEIVEVLKPSLK